MKWFLLLVGICVFHLKGVGQMEVYPDQGLKQYYDELQRTPYTPKKAQPADKYKDLLFTYPEQVSKKAYRKQAFHDNVRLFLKAQYLEQALQGGYDRIGVIYCFSDNLSERIQYYTVSSLKTRKGR